MNHTLDGPEGKWQRDLDRRAARLVEPRVVVIARLIPNPDPQIPRQLTPEIKPLARGVMFALAFMFGAIALVLAIVVMRHLRWI